MGNQEQLAKGKEAVELEKKLTRKYGKEFAQELRGMDKSGLENKLLGLVKHSQEIITTKNRDEELELAKDKHNELEAPYKDQVKANKEKSRFIHLILKEKDPGEYSTDDTQITLTSEQSEVRLS